MIIEDLTNARNQIKEDIINNFGITDLMKLEGILEMNFEPLIINMRLEESTPPE